MDYLKEKLQENFENGVLPQREIRIPQRGNGWKSLKNGKHFKKTKY